MTSSVFLILQRIKLPLADKRFIFAKYRILNLRLVHSYSMSHTDIMYFENLEQIDNTKSRQVGAKNESKNQYKHIYPYDETLGTASLLSANYLTPKSGTKGVI